MEEKPTGFLNNWRQRLSITGAPAPEDKPLLHWEAPEFYMVDKSLTWGVIAIIVFVALAGMFVYFGQILVAVLVVLFLLVTIKLAYAKPEKLEYRVDPDGVRVAGWLHPFYKEIVGFWIGRQGNKAVVYFKTKSILNEHISMPLGDQSPKKAARVLEKHIPEYHSITTEIPQTVRS